MEVGYLPIFIEGEDTYLLKLNQIITTIVDTDLSYIVGYYSGTANKVKKLFFVLYRLKQLMLKNQPFNL